MISKTFKITDPLPKELDSKNTLIIVFYSKEFDQIKTLQQQFPLSTIVGCSTAGEIYSNIILDEAVISINKFESTRFKVFHKTISLDNSFNCGRYLGLKLLDKDLKGVVILSEGLNINGSQFTHGLKKSIQVPVFGGLSGDGGEFKKTSVLHQDHFLNSEVIAIGFYGNLNFNCETGGGWIKFGPQRKVTKSVNTKILELDSKPALDLYKEYVGKESSNLPASALYYPLCFHTKDNREITRTVLGVNEEDKSIILAGEIPEGATVSLMHADFSELIAGAASCGEKLKILDNKNSLSLAVSCVGRRMVLGEYAESEIDALINYNKIPNLIGFYSYGEIAPLEKQNNCELHNQSIAILNIKEN